MADALPTRSFGVHLSRLINSFEPSEAQVARLLIYSSGNKFISLRSKLFTCAFMCRTIHLLRYLFTRLSLDFSCTCLLHLRTFLPVYQAFQYFIDLVIYSPLRLAVYLFSLVSIYLPVYTYAPRSRLFGSPVIRSSLFKTTEGDVWKIILKH